MASLVTGLTGAADLETMAAELVSGNGRKRNSQETDNDVSSPVQKKRSLTNSPRVSPKVG